jgi:hypothetical protein
MLSGDVQPRLMALLSATCWFLAFSPESKIDRVRRAAEKWAKWLKSRGAAGLQVAAASCPRRKTSSRLAAPDACRALRLAAAN